MLFVGVKMARIISLSKQALRFPVIWVGVLYLFWLMFIPINESYIPGIILLGAYLIITVLEKLANRSWLFSLALVFVLLPIVWEASILTFWLLTGWLDREVIFIVLVIVFAGYPLISILQKPSSKDKVLSLLLFIVTLPVLAINVIYFVSYFPEVVDQTKFGEFKYYIVSGIDMDYHSHLSFYKCKQWSLKCDILYGTYDRQDFEEIIIDKEKNEVSAISSEPHSRLVYTDGEHSRLYEGYPTRLGDHIYQMSTEYDAGTCASSSCDTYIYTLYECNLNYTSCNPLPVQYSAVYDNVIILNANEITDEINASDGDDTLIFTYGKHPVCYVDGCVILDQ